MARNGSSFSGAQNQPGNILLRHNGLHIDIQIDPTSPIGATDAAGVKDVVLEAALTTIQDCEDSVAAVDAEDKAVVWTTFLFELFGPIATRHDNAIYPICIQFPNSLTLPGFFFKFQTPCCL